MTKSIKGQQGFSLVELMVVVAIIGILAAIAIPNFQKFSAKARQSEVKSNLSAIYSAEQAFRAEWMTYSTNFLLIGYSPTGNLRYDHGFSTDFPAKADLPSGLSPASDILTTADKFCDRKNSGCSVIKTPIAPGEIATAKMTGTYFIAQGRGDLDGVKGDDIWTIDSGKNLLNPTSDINK